jgi:hypothetical protein
MRTQPEYLRMMTTGTIHIVVDDWDIAAAGWRVRALCGQRHLTGSLVHTTPDKMWRNPDLCRKCAEHRKAVAS